MPTESPNRLFGRCSTKQVADVETTKVKELKMAEIWHRLESKLTLPLLAMLSVSIHASIIGLIN